ncbi:MAG: DUF4625 domain-containing protein [Bacteroidales bacterium]|nr:DUF4625 domain-containing protein [Bacteroidales bacterium]
MACGDKDDEKRDMQRPSITDKGIEVSPSNCQSFKRGDSIPFRYVFTDNEELGAYNIEIHNNFTHHTHSTAKEDCDLDTEKHPVNPWVYNHDFAIPQNSTEYTADFNIPVPKDKDVGDYHFMIRLTDKAGWQEIKSVEIKITE